MTPSYFRRQLKQRIASFRNSNTERDKAYWRGTGHELMYIMLSHNMLTPKQFITLMSLFA